MKAHEVEQKYPAVATVKHLLYSDVIVLPCSDKQQSGLFTEKLHSPARLS